MPVANFPIRNKQYTSFNSALPFPRVNRLPFLCLDKVALSLLEERENQERNGPMTSTRFKKILVPVDFSFCSEEAFRVAKELATIFDARLLFLHVIDTAALEALNNMGLASPSEEKIQKKKLQHFARFKARTLLQTPDSKSLDIERILSEGKPFVEIIRTARTEKVDLIVMGSYGGQTADVGRIFFGSTAEQVVRTANCPVLCVPFPYAKTTGAKNVTPQKPKAKRSKRTTSS